MGSEKAAKIAARALIISALITGILGVLNGWFSTKSKKSLKPSISTLGNQSPIVKDVNGDVNINVGEKNNSNK